MAEEIDQDAMDAFLNNILVRHKAGSKPTTTAINDIAEAMLLLSRDQSANAYMKAFVAEDGKGS